MRKNPARNAYLKSTPSTLNNSYLTATDLADWLVSELNYSFREAYNVTGKSLIMQ